MSEYRPFVNSGPGDAVKSELEFYQWEQKDLAEIMNWSEKHVSNLIKNKVPVTYDTALKLSRIFKQSVQFWLNLDAQYRERLEADAEIKETEARALIYRYMPVNGLRKIGLLSKNPAILKKEVCAFWHTDNLDFSFLDKKVSACFRKSQAYDHFNPFYALTWLQAVKNEVEKRTFSAKYDAGKLASLANSLGAYTANGNDGVKSFIADLEACGVVFSHVPHLPQTYTDGASFFVNGNPVMAYSGRLDRIDNFWFTVAHETGHILLHLHNENDMFIDSMDNIDLTDEREKQADAFAGKILKNSAVIKAFANTARHSRNKIIAEAKRLNLSPAIVAGCLQHHKKAAWTSFHELKPNIKPMLKSFSHS